MRLSLIIPCFNEAPCIPGLLLALDGSVADLTRQGHEVEVLIVDDGSRDGSDQLLLEGTRTRPWLRGLRFARNFGQTAAMAAGIQASSGEVLVTLDADLQNDPADIPSLLDRLNEGYDVVSGWRRRRQDPPGRVLVSRFANRLIASFSGVDLHDFGCTLKAYRREVLDGVRLYGEMHRFLPVWAALGGARITELVVQHHPRKLGRSKYGFERIPNVVLDLLLVRLLWSYGTKPIHIFGKFGLAAIGASLLIFLAMIWFKIWGGKTFIETPLPQLATTFFLVGCLAILTGFLAEITVRTYHEAAGNPTYVVREQLRGGERSAVVGPARPAPGH